MNPINHLKLVPIPAHAYPHYRYAVQLQANKYDSQMGGVNTIADHVLVISQELNHYLAAQTVAMSREVTALEQVLRGKAPNTLTLGRDKSLIGTLSKIARAAYQPEHHTRWMRFDFHLTTDGLAVSEVNADVPAGTSESTELAQIAWDYLADTTLSVPQGISVPIARSIKDTIERYHARKHQPLLPSYNVALVYDQRHLDDIQVIKGLVPHLQQQGLNPVHVRPNQLTQREGRIYQHHSQTPIHAIHRYYPAEWLAAYDHEMDTPGASDIYFTTDIPQSNHPTALLTQSKDNVLVAKAHGIDLPTISQHFPQTLPTTAYFGQVLRGRKNHYVAKPLYGRVGDGVSIPGVDSQQHQSAVLGDILRYPRNWVFQQKFHSKPLYTSNSQPYHLLIGTFTVNNTFAGYYARLSHRAKFDEYAIDVPVLVATKLGEPHGKSKQARHFAKMGAQ